MMDWDSDPALKAIRDEYVDSFPGRRTHLKSLMGDFSEISRAEIRVIAHNLAGSGESYGFPSLTRVGTALDDFITLNPGIPDSVLLAEFSALLMDMLAEATRLRSDPGMVFSADARMTKLISAAESLASEAKT